MSNRPLLGIAPGASYGPAKKWPARNYAQAAQEIALQKNMLVVIFGGAAENETAWEVKNNLFDVPVLDLTGKMELAQTLAVISGLGLMLTNDSGLMHASAALNVPTLAVFGSTNPLTTSPLGKNVKILRKPVNCSPCLQPYCARGDYICLTNISPEEVIEQSLPMLENKSD